MCCCTVHGALRNSSHSKGSVKVARSDLRGKELPSTCKLDTKYGTYCMLTFGNKIVNAKPHLNVYSCFSLHIQIIVNFFIYNSIFDGSLILETHFGGPITSRHIGAHQRHHFIPFFIHIKYNLYVLFLETF